MNVSRAEAEVLNSHLSHSLIGASQIWPKDQKYNF